MFRLSTLFFVTRINKEAEGFYFRILFLWENMSSDNHWLHIVIGHSINHQIRISLVWKIMLQSGKAV